ncbi:2OG-Fe(II) oxygenase, partial [archaeon]
VPTPLSSSSSPLPPPTPADIPPEKQSEYIKCSAEINDMIQTAKGDMSVLKGLLHAYLASLEVDYIESVVVQVITDNIQACHTHGYVNKEKLLAYIKSMIDNYLASKMNNENVNTINSSTYHAPQFLDASRHHDNSQASPLSNLVSAASISSIQHQLTTSSQMNNKKKRKEVQRQLNQLYANLVGPIADNLLNHHYVVIENFIHVQLVQRVHIEASKLARFYEESEIWVGKGADIGAHLSVPNIRGDKVLWLCGGHQLMKLAPNQKKKSAATTGKASSTEQENNDQEECTALMPLNNSEVKLFEPARSPDEDESMRGTNHMAVEGNGRAITTHGEIEPCKLTIKTRSPVKRFMALKDLILQCDTMISYLRVTHPLFENIYERSDVMLAIYPGNGARFANHIDNTTQDGRRLTLVVYLNENWQDDMGGALRITEPAIKPPIVLDSAPASNVANEAGGQLTQGSKELDGKFTLFLLTTHE